MYDRAASLPLSTMSRKWTTVVMPSVIWLPVMKPTCPACGCIACTAGTLTRS
jgi:hypothetical protein